ncbi:hypothetical protein JQX13_40425 [Archangium violaceum]|uniref:hypothetical protein n=1 Tax=Archangium violaceum TaxID=83451 RepID=UPI00193C224D|nr:hypothetical protein [Archangium violaceum]QRK06315.1 hypothetical protein JQX13_40425 [Archangium violaceum]
MIAFRHVSGAMSNALTQCRVIRAMLWLAWLMVVPGCPDKKTAPNLVAGDAGVVVVDAGGGADSETDAGSTGAEAAAMDAGPQAATAVKPPTIVPAGAIDDEDSEQSLLRNYAKVLQWSVEDESLDSYWEVVERLNVGDRQFTLVRLAKHSEPRGGQQQWLLVRKHQKSGPVSYSPLATQYPFTPDHWQQVKPIGMKLQPLEKSSSSVLWIRLREKSSESGNGGEHIKDKERQLAYAFLVDERGAFKALALQIPEKVTLSVDDEVTAETTLEINIPSVERLIIRPGPTGVDAEQQSWLGEHSLTR